MKMAGFYASTLPLHCLYIAIYYGYNMDQIRIYYGYITVMEIDLRNIYV